MRSLLASAGSLFAARAAILARPSASPRWRARPRRHGRKIVPAIPMRWAPRRVLTLEPGTLTRVGVMQYPQSLSIGRQGSGAHFRRRPVAAIFQPDTRHPRRAMREGDLLPGRHHGRAYPAVVRRMYDAGHSIGTHSEDHPPHFKNCRLRRRAGRSTRVLPMWARRSAIRKSSRPSSAFRDWGAPMPPRKSLPHGR